MGIRLGVREWSFLSNHGLTLLCLVRDNDARIRDVADRIGVTERAAHRLISDLVDAGYVKRERIGRRNRYRVQPDVAMRHPLLEHMWIGELLAVLAASPSEAPGSALPAQPGLGET